MPPPFTKLVLPVGHVPQQRIGDCLVACAGMLLTYANKPFHYCQVLRQLKTNDFGTVFSNIRHLTVPGATVQVSRGDIDRLYQHLQRNQPLAVALRTAELPHWYNDPSRGEEVAHAVVVVGMDQTMVYLNDPAFQRAPLQVPHGEFQLARIDFDELYAALVPS